MLCAIQAIGTGLQHLSGKMSFEEEDEPDDNVDMTTGSAVFAPSERCLDNTPDNSKHTASIEKTLTKKEVKHVEKASRDKPSDMDDKPKKKKKWRQVPIHDVGFNMSLFPRPLKTDHNRDPQAEEKLFYKIDAEIQEMVDIVSKVPTFDKNFTDLIEGTSVQETKYIRPDRDRKYQKASLQVKDKYCRSLKNNDGRKDLFINHRVFKKINLDPKRTDLHLPSRKSSANVYTPVVQSQPGKVVKPNPPIRNERAAPVQNLNHTLHETNAPSDIDTNLLNLLISLQHRDLSPEDYETLLQLDESVAPKTLDQSVLEQFKTDTVDDITAGEICAVCLDPYEIGQQRKFLPCNHVFHDSCITMWLENSSRNCPVDGLPVDGS